METLVFKYPFETTLTKILESENIVSLIGFYGESETLALALNDYFGQNLQIDSGFSLCLNKDLNKAALVYSSGDKIICGSQECSKTFIAYLLTICEEIVACFSGNVVKKWYIEDRAKFRGHFKKGFESINTGLENSLEMKLDPKFCISNKLFNLNDMQISQNFAYIITENLKNPDNSVTIQNLASALVLKLFKVPSNLKNVKSKFTDFLDSIEDIIYCTPETIKEIFECLQDLFMKLLSSIPEIYRNLCESIKQELFIRTEISSQSIQILKFSLIDSFLEQIIKNPQTKTYDKITEIFNEAVVSQLDPEEKNFAVTTFNNYLNQAIKDINILEEGIINQAREKLSILERFRVIQIFEITENLVEKMNKVEEKAVTRSFVISLSNRVGTLKNLDKLGNKGLVCLFVNEDEKGTNLLVVLDGGKYLHHFSQGTNYLIVKGCDEDCLVLVDNSRFIAYLFAVEDEELISKGSKNFDGVVKFPHYLKKTKEIIYINNEDRPVLSGLGLDDQPKYYNLSPFAINTSCTDEKFEYIFLSEDNKILGLVLKHTLLLIHRQFELVHHLILEKSKFLHAFIYNTAEDYFLIIINKSGNKHYKLILSPSASQHSFQNSILDILEDSLSTIYNKSHIKCKNLSVFIEPGYLLPESSLFNYYSLLKTINSSITLKSLFNPSESTSSISLNSLSSTLFRYSSAKLFEINPFELQPNLFNHLNSQENDPILLKVKKMLNYDFFESEIKQIESLCVVAIIASKWEEIEKVLQNVFHVVAFEQNENEVCLRFARVRNQDFSIITWLVSHTRIDLDTLKAYELVTALADRVILTTGFRTMNHVPRIAREILFAKGRISGDCLYCYEFDLVVLESEANGASKIEEFVKLLPKQTYACLFSKACSSTFLAENLLYQMRIASKPARFSGREFIECLKIVLSQLIIGDNHSFDYWKNKSWLSISSQNFEPCPETSGICDYVTKIANDEFSSIPIKLPKDHSRFHYCNEKCLDCDAYCLLEYGHFGYHSTKLHVGCDINFFTNKRILLGGNNTEIQNMHKSWNDRLWESPLQSIYDLI